MSNEMSQELVQRRSLDGHDGFDQDGRHIAPNGRVTHISRNGHDRRHLLAPELGMTEPSRLLAYLPAIYSADEFVGRFLRIFQDTLDPIDQLIENLPNYFHPAIAPPELVDWLAHWVGMEDRLDWPLVQRRQLVAQAVQIYGKRGTVDGLKLHLKIATGEQPLVQENTDGFRLGDDAGLGYNTMLGVERNSWFTVTVIAKKRVDVDEELLREIIDQEKPVGTAPVLRVVEK